MGCVPPFVESCHSNSVNHCKCTYVLMKDGPGVNTSRTLRVGCDQGSPQALLLAYLLVALRGGRNLKGGSMSHGQVTAQCTVHLLKVVGWKITIDCSILK